MADVVYRRGARHSHRCDAARKAMWQSCASPRGAQVAQGGANAWQGPHESTRTPGRGAMWPVRGWRVKGS